MINTSNSRSKAELDPVVVLGYEIVLAQMCLPELDLSPRYIKEKLYILEPVITGFAEILSRHPLPPNLEALTMECCQLLAIGPRLGKATNTLLLPVFDWCKVVWKGTPMRPQLEAARICAEFLSVSGLDANDKQAILKVAFSWFEKTGFYQTGAYLDAIARSWAHLLRMSGLNDEAKLTLLKPVLDLVAQVLPKADLDKVNAIFQIYAEFLPVSGLNPAGKQSYLQEVFNRFAQVLPEVSQDSTDVIAENCARLREMYGLDAAAEGALLKPVFDGFVAVLPVTERKEAINKLCSELLTQGMAPEPLKCLFAEGDESSFESTCVQPFHEALMKTPPAQWALTALKKSSPAFLKEIDLLTKLSQALIGERPPLMQASLLDKTPTLTERGKVVAAVFDQLQQLASACPDGWETNRTSLVERVLQQKTNGHSAMWLAVKEGSTEAITAFEEGMVKLVELGFVTGDVATNVLATELGDRKGLGACTEAAKGTDGLASNVPEAPKLIEANLLRTGLVRGEQIGAAPELKPEYEKILHAHRGPGPGLPGQPDQRVRSL